MPQFSNIDGGSGDDNAHYVYNFYQLPCTILTSFHMSLFSHCNDPFGTVLSPFYRKRSWDKKGKKIDQDHRASKCGDWSSLLDNPTI